MKKILLDTDIGSDIDDIICLSYLLNNPECDLLGITTVTGESLKRVGLAQSICDIAKKDIKIVCGKTDPLIIDQRQPIAEQAIVVKNLIGNNNQTTKNPIDFLRSVIRSNPYEITLLAIGPLTNIAILFLVDPELLSMLDNLVIMCGSFSGSNLENIKIEWNALCDPHAAEIIYKTKIKRHYSIGLDVTQKVTMTRGEFIEKFSSEKLKHILPYAEIWFEKENIITFHDPLAASFIFKPELFEFKNGYVEVDTTNPRTMGYTNISFDKNGPHSVATNINVGKFYEHFFSMFYE